MRYYIKKKQILCILHRKGEKPNFHVLVRQMQEVMSYLGWINARKVKYTSATVFQQTLVLQNKRIQDSKASAKRVC